MIDHPFQLRAIELRDFKSVRDQRVELGPLTIVVGANSAGKSTLLQAILALAQAVRTEGATPEFPLNGSLIRLGTFDETRNYLSQAETAQMEIQFELVDTSAHMARFVPPRRARAFRSQDELIRSRPAWVINWHAFIEPVGDDDASDGHEKRGFAEITRLILSVSDANSGSDPELMFQCDINPQDDPELMAELSDLPVDNRRSPLGRTAGSSRPIPVIGRALDLVDSTPPRMDAVVLSGGVPHAFLQRTTRFRYLAELWWSAADGALAGEHERLFDPENAVIDDEDRPDLSDVLPVAPRLAAEHIAELLEGVRESRFRARSLVTRIDVADRHFFQAITRLAEDKRRDLGRSMAAQGMATFVDALLKLLTKHDLQDEEILLEQSGTAADALARGGRLAQSFFNARVEYLGPLREAPQVLYDPGPTQTDLGPRGEYTAAVLHAQARTQVVMPATLDSRATREPERLPLEEALNRWLQWFGLADNAISEDRGRLGIGLSVTPAALGRPVDLTSVGIGVSQVLPVILQCLLAEPGTLVVLEQPELHLHPRLQHDLADFLVACVESGRQLVIESHSEHLVNRLRRRIAADETDRTRDLVKLVFAENMDGVTTYRESSVNRYGGLNDDWPDGFLDVGARESSALIRESAAKRRRDTAT